MGKVITRLTTCAHCGKHNVLLRRQIKADGTAHFAWRCLDCDRWAEIPPKWLPHRELEARLSKQGGRLEDIPIVEDHSDQQPCCVCGEPGQYHHWAPQAMSEQFGEDWYKWPGKYLCPRHHTQWHRIVTPDLIGWRARLQAEEEGRYAYMEKATRKGDRVA